MDYGDGNQYPSEPKRKQKSNWIIPILLGVIIGILLVTVAMPAILDTNLMKEAEDEQQNADQPESNTEQQDMTEDSVINVDINTQLTDIVEEVSPAVVGVTNIQLESDFWEHSGGSEAGTGSGVIYKKDKDYDYVVTNHHVVEGADEIEVVLYNDEHVEAKLLGSDL